MCWSTNGLYVSSHGKVSLLKDTDHDGKADEEEIIASGWPPTDVGSGGVDATAVTTDRDGNLYFGLLVADYSNPYRVQDGVSHYDINSKRGTIQKFNVRTKQLETIATGIRVPYSLLFNRAGNLFNTDQEGETWCPNGNPLDELNVIIPGRNYGFPPRHEKWLPDLISEPPVVAFGPQHQSSCGLVFNEPNAHQKLFGPSWWEGDAFVCGESRGKIFRVKLVKTPAGYIGKEYVIARLNMLTLDAAISPRGDLYVCCHSGNPDWGTGPQGIGKIYKISYTDPGAPQPMEVFAANATTVRVTFNKPIDPVITNRVADMKIEFGEYVSTGDRFENLKPPYKAVAYQESTPRGKLRVLSASVPFSNVLQLETEPHPQSVQYALTVPGVHSGGLIGGASGSTNTIDVSYGLNGIEAFIAPNDPRARPTRGIFPHFDRLVNDALAEFPRFGFFFNTNWQNVTLESQLALPGRNPKLHVEGYSVDERTGDQGQRIARINIGRPKESFLKVSFTTEDDPTPRPVPLNALLFPWAPPPHPVPHMPENEIQITGGDYERGRELFFGEKLKCSTCHRLRGEGATVGPDLSNLVHRDPAAILRDIQEPNAAINPDYVAYNVATRNDEHFTGFVRAQSAQTLQIIAVDGKEYLIGQKEIMSLKPSGVSLMPTGLLEGLPENDIRSLLTFLTTAPPTREGSESIVREDVKFVVRRPLNIVFVASKHDHGPGQHDYPAWQKEWMQRFGNKPDLKLSTAWEWPQLSQWETANVIVFYFWNHTWSNEQYAQLDDFQKHGGGAVFLHAACIADKDPEKLAERIGLAAQPGRTGYLHTPFTLKFANTNHPMALKAIELPMLDEPYWPMIGDTNRVQILATANIDSADQPLIWTYQRGKGKVFVSVPSHYTWTWEDPAFEALIWRAIHWVATPVK
jgi:putative heme-binding domain-containing protein